MSAAREPRHRRLLLAVVAAHALAIALLLRPVVAPPVVPSPAMLLVDYPAPLPPATAPGTMGEAAPAAPLAKPKPVAARPPVVPAPNQPAAVPATAEPATDVAAGAAAADDGGLAAGGTGAGTGAGAGGPGTGGGVVTRARRIAGDIVRGDYPRARSKAETGGSVTIRLDVGADGRVSGCTVVHPGPSATRDAITCRLATERFRYAPARDGQGRAVADVAGWRQQWWPEH